MADSPTTMPVSPEPAVTPEAAPITTPPAAPAAPAQDAAGETKTV